MSRPTDDDLRDVLTETFRAHEHLADVERAVAIASSPGRPRHTGRALLGAAAAVVLVTAGTTYVVTKGHDGRGGTVKLGPATTQSTSAEGVTRANRVFAERLADQTLEGLRARAGRLPGGSREVRAEQVPALTKLTSFIGPGVGHNFTRSAFFLAPGEAHEVALWFAAHPPAGSWSDGGPTGVGGSRNADGSWSDEADFDYRLSRQTTDRASLASLVQVTPVGDGVGIRVTVFGSWRPGRPAASYVSGVTSVRVHLTDERLQRHPRTSHRTWTFTAPGGVGRIVARYNSLPGGGAVGMSCPMPLERRTYRISFTTASGPVTAVGTSFCGDLVTVRREGHTVPPTVDGSRLFPFLDDLLGLHD